MTSVSAETLGSAAFREEHRLRRAYVAGAMYKGIASVELVVQMGQHGLLGYFGSGGLRLEQIEDALVRIQQALSQGGSYGMNLLANPLRPDLEEATVALYLRKGVSRVEAAAYTQITLPLVWFRTANLNRDSVGRVQAPNHVLAKVSHPDVARAFLAPPPGHLLQQLVDRGQLTSIQAQWAERIPMANDLCVEADSGGHTDKGVASVLMPAMTLLRDESIARFRYDKPVRIGAAGGLGTPQAIAAAFMLGADFVLTGSINQCSVEAGTSDLAKDMLASADVQDCAMAPAGDLFEVGARVQVLKKGVFFPARANRLYELYQQLDGLHQLEASVQRTLEERYFGRTLEAVWEETRQFYARHAPDQLEAAEKLPKRRMALVFQWYFVHANRMALRGERREKVNFQIQCGPAMGAFNRWVQGTPLEDWRARHVHEMGAALMEATAAYMNKRWASLAGTD